MTPVRYLSWPSDIPAMREQPRSLWTNTEGAESLGGINSDEAVFMPAQKRTYRGIYQFPNEPGGSRYEWTRKWNWLATQFRGEATRIWYKESCPRWLEKIRLGIGDGTRTAFPFPLGSATDGPFAYAGGVWDDSALISPIAGNALSDSQAIDISGINARPNTVLSTTSAQRYYYGAGLQSTPIASGANIGWISDNVVYPPTWPTYGIFWARGDASLTVQASVAYRDAAQATISFVVSSPAQIYPDVWTPIFVDAGVSPANTAYASLSGFSSVASTLPWWCDCRGLMLQDAPEWWLPSEAPYMVLPTSPPAIDEVVEGSGTGYWSALCSLASSEIGDAITPGGHVQMRGLEFREVWESKSA